jgi:hypothetical protein
MSVAVSKTLLFGSGEIKFSDLRSNFKLASSGTLSATELRRVTSTSNTNPIVPDATENASISTSNNLSLSQFRNSIKYYDLNQSGTDTNLDVDAQTWNSNLSKSIIKRVNINGTCGSTSVGSPALTFDALVYNLFVIVNGSVLGAAGATGSGSGGNAMSLISSGGAIYLTTNSGSAVYGGGGGGANGATGATGLPGGCHYFNNYSTGNQCGGCPGCAGGYYATRYCYRVGGCGKRGRTAVNRTDCQQRVDYQTAAPLGGAGGNGGNGEGYTVSRTSGTAGSAGETTSCGGNITDYVNYGGTGETGGAGGDWGTNGGSTTNAGGSAGRAVAGSNYSITAESVTSAFKGLK